VGFIGKPVNYGLETLILFSINLQFHFFKALNLQFCLFFSNSDLEKITSVFSVLVKSTFRRFDGPVSLILVRGRYGIPPILFIIYSRVSAAQPLYSAARSIRQLPRVCSGSVASGIVATGKGGYGACLQDGR
jgi:hypothetical protein